VQRTGLKRGLWPLSEVVDFRWPEVEEEAEEEMQEEKNDTVVIEGEIIVLDP